jgi:gliding motility-associated-like protein
MKIDVRRLFLTLCLVLGFVGTTQAQVTANFSGTPLSGCSPLVVQFTDLSTGPVTTWFWDFGNGNTSTLQNPGAVYVTPGTYTVSLTVSNGVTPNTFTQTNYVTVFQNPTAALTNTTPRNGCAPLNVCFGDISTPGSGAISGWLWDFGDGNTSTAAAPCHTYAAAGVYTVSMVATDVNGCHNTVVMPNFVNVSTPPTASFQGAPLAACVPPLNVTFSNFSSGGAAPRTYQWDFGDGSPISTATNPTHTYNASGAFNVTLITVDANGCSDTLVRPAYINIGTVVAAFTPNTTTICEGQSVTFTDNSTGNPNSWNWDFGDGGTSTAASPTHTYNAAGTYTVTLIASNGACSDTEVQTALITVNPAPVANLVADTTQGCAVPFAVQFTDLSTGPISTWAWNFGDGNTSTLQNPAHTYTAPGTYTVTLTVTGPNGCTDNVVFTNYIQIVPPVADFVGVPIMGCIPLPVAFTDISNSVEPIVSWQWDFGDGNTSTAQNPSNTYTTPGAFTVSLIIVNSAGCTDTIIRPAYIQAGTPPVACFTVNPTVACVNAPVNFTDCSTNATGWFWMFGDGGTSNAQNPTYAYQDTGCFTVTLIASNLGCTDDTIIANVVCITPPLARFNLNPATGCDTPLVVTFTDNSILPDTWLWDFGDGSPTTNVQNPTHTYTTLGTFTVTLTVADTVNGCVDDANATVTITHPVANFTGTSLNGCGPLTVNFTDLSTGATTWAWDFGDGGVSNAQNPTHTYQNPGTYTVTLVIGDNNGCTDTHVEVSFVQVIGPLVDFSGTPLAGCDSMLVNFTDLSTPTAPITSWAWDFGDGNNSALQNPSHMYMPGTYTVSLTLTDANGCVRTLTRNNYVSVTDPHAGFTVNDTITCTGVALQFTNTSVGTGLNYLWDFGDGNTSTAQNPSHAYAANGNYTVTLSITDVNGCTDASIQVNLVTISNALAAFNANPTSASCPPLLVAFNDLSFWDITGWTWTFGDGTGSTLQNPAHVYATSGSYDVSLAVVTDDGCRDTLLMPGLINILGPNGNFTFDPDTGCTPQSVHFVANATNTAVYTWDFGDGNVGISTIDSIDHVYTQTGTFHPILILDDGLGCTFSILSPDSIVIDTIPLVNFGVNANVFCRLDTVRFTDLTFSTRPITSWYWDFGDGNTSNLQNPSHYYAAPGSYTVSLGVVNQFGCTDTVALPANVSLFFPPTAAFLPSDTIGCNPLTVNFTDASTGNQPITAWDWTFGDGNTSAIQNPSNTYPTGNYLVTFIAIDSAGCRDTVTNDIVVNPGPIAGFVADDSVGCPPMPVQFTANGGMGIIGWNWDFGDGNFGAGITTGHIYPLSGSYTVTLAVVDTLGCVDTLVKPQYIQIHPPVADFTQNLTSGCPPLTVIFTDNSTATNGVVQWNWNFGDGNTGTGTPVTHTYALPGQYTVTLIVVDAQGCRDTIVKPNLITVFQPPVAHFGIVDSLNCDPFTILLGDSSTSVSSTVVAWQWNFGDGGTSNLQNPTHAYAIPGNYVISLIAIDANGCRDTTTLPFVSPAPPIAAFSALDTTLCIGQVTTFTADTTGGIISFEWDFGDGGPHQFGNPVNYNYGLAGNYTVTLIVENNLGCRDTLVRPLYINVHQPTAGFSVNPTSGCVPLTVSFSDQSISPFPIVTWDWNFGDFTTASGSPNVQHTYTAPGQYSVGLSITDNQGCPATTIFNFVTVFAPPIADFGITDTLNCDPFTVQLTDSSTSPGSTVVGWNWNFGDGGTSTVQNPSHAYLISGPYTITLIATNANGCLDTFSLPIIAPAPPAANFTASDTLLCIGGTTVFTADTTGGIVSFEWDFGDGSPVQTGNPVSHTYTTQGSFTVTLIIENSIGCRDTLTRPQYIDIHPPQADFLQNAVAGCPPLAVTFTSISAHIYPLVAVNWDFGDGNTGTGSPITHTYTTPGTYTVMLIIIDSLGCIDTLTQPNLITIFQPPVANFGITDTLNCQPFTIQLTDSTTSTFPITSWAWNFGDGQTSNAQNPIHAYPNLGTYIISLITTDANGCSDTATLPFTVPVRPQANFIALDSAGCDPFDAIFIADSLNVIGFAWNFGDGQTSTVGPQVIHSYQNAGHYTVTLVIQDVFGCSDTLVKPNYIFVDSLVADFTMNVGTGCPPLPVDFTDQSYSDTTIVSWLWNFGDGSGSGAQNPSHTYTAPGTVTVTLIVQNIIGCTDTISYNNLTIYDNLPPGVPPILMATVESNTNDSISWRAYTQPDFSHYVLWWEQPTGSNTWTPIDSFFNAQDTTYRHFGLNTLSNSYCYRLQVVDVCGFRSSLDSSQKHCTIDLEATAGIDQAILNWNRYVGWDSVHFYDVYRVTNYDTLLAQYLGSVNGGTTTFIDSNVVCYQDYCYRVRAREFGGYHERSWSDTSCALPIHVPNALPIFICSATVQNDSFVEIFWSLPPNSQAQTLFLDRSTDGQNWGQYVQLPPNQGSYVDLNVDVHSESYWYRISMIDSCGDLGPYSNIGRTILLEGTDQGGLPFLEWNAYEQWPNGVQQYPLEVFNDVTQTWQPVTTLPISPLQFSDALTNLDQPIYCYRLYADQNGGGCRSLSNTTCVPVGPTLFAPNAFTPNSDGINEFFQLKGHYIADFHFMLFDRWGALIFESFDLNNSWDGHWRDKACQEGVYVWVATAHGFDGTEIKLSGDCTLIR